MDFSPYFHQMAAGVIGLLPVVPWRAVGKGYYLVNLLVGLALLAAGRFLGGAGGPGSDGGGGSLLGDPGAWVLATGGLALAASLVFLSGRGSAGAALTLLAALAGAGTVLLEGLRAAGAARGPAAHPALLAFNFLAGALLLGSVISAMLLGHWYLVVKDLPVRPLKTLTLLFFAALGARLAATAGAFLLDPAGGGAVARRSFLFVLVYGLFSLGTPLAMSWMVWGTVKIRSTQAATGILYGITVFILMGEASGRFVLLRTGFPL